MPELRLVIETAAAGLVGLGPHPKAVLISESGRRYVLPFAPMLDRAGLAPRFSTFERVGRKSLMAKAGLEARSMSGEFMAVGRDATGYADPQVSIEADLAIIRAMAAEGERVHWEGFGPSEAGAWRITALAESDLRRQHGTNEITQAKVSMTLTEVVEASAHLGPVTGGAAPAAAAVVTSEAAAAAVTTAPAPSITTYTVKRGDTLAGIASQFYKNPSLWPRIADANAITNPKTLAVGKVLTIPAL